jgi:hypothetical protein
MIDNADNFDGKSDLPKSESMEKIKSSIDKLASKIEKSKPAPKKISPAKQEVITLSMGERYKRAWTKTYDKQQEWRKKEIDNSKKDGTFGIKDWDDDFVKQVVELAESDNFLSGEVSSTPDK